MASIGISVGDSARQQSPRWAGRRASGIGDSFGNSAGSGGACAGPAARDRRRAAGTSVSGRGSDSHRRRAGRLIYQDTYNTDLEAQIPAIVAAADQHSFLMLAGGATGSSTLLLLGAAPTADVLYDEGTSNNTQTANGLGWYFSSDYSWGFAPAGDPVERFEADVLTTPDDNERLSWHTVNDAGGYRLGDITGLNESTAYSRYIFAADSGSSPTFVVADAPLADATPTHNYLVNTDSTGSRVVATFTDGNPLATAAEFPAQNLVINWGDNGPTSTGTVRYVSANSTSSTWEVVGSHTYSQDGTYGVSVAIADVDGNTTSSSGTSFTIDTTPPIVSLTAPANGSVVSTSEPTFFGDAGTATGDLPAITVNIYSGDTATGPPVESLDANASGSSYSVPATSVLTDGTYTAQASQSDQAGNTGVSSPVTFTIVTLTPSAGGPYTITEGDSLSLDASGSSDSNGDSLSYSWTINGNTNAASGVNPTISWATLASLGVTYSTSTFPISVTVSDGHGNSETASTTLTVNDAPPSANPGGPYSGIVNGTIDFDGSGSTDVYAAITQYDWNFGDNASYQGAVPAASHAYTAPGEYNASLTVINSNGTSSTAADFTVIVVPAVTGVSTTDAGGTYGLGAVIPITLSFNGPVTVTGMPTLALSDGGTASYASDSGSALTFDYTVAAGQSATALDIASTTALSLNGGTINDSSGDAAALALPAVGGGSTVAPGKAIAIDTTAPTITSVTTASTTGTYGIGAVILITIHYSKGVQVTGTPTLALDSGGTASYTPTGSTATALVFSYTVAGGQSASALDISGATALSLSGGAIVQAGVAGGTNNASITLPTGQSDGLPGQHLAIDGIVPTVSSITTTTASGTYGIGQTITFKVNFSKAVDVATTGGTPTLALNSGGTAIYASGTGTQTLTFTYTTSAGDSASALDYSGATALALNGGTIREHGLAAGVNNANLTLPTPGQTGSISNTKTIAIVPANSLKFVPAAAQVLTAGVVSSAFSIELVDANNHPITIKTGAEPFVVKLSTTAASGQFRDTSGVNTITSLSFSAAASTVSFKYYQTKVGNPRLTAASATLGVSATETVNPNVGAQIAFVQQPHSANANEPILPIVQVLDQFGNVVPNVVVTLTLTPISLPATDAGLKPRLSQTSLKTNASGEASFVGTSVNLPGTYTLTASMSVNGELISVTSEMFTIKGNLR